MDARAPAAIASELSIAVELALTPVPSRPSRLACSRMGEDDREKKTERQRNKESVSSSCRERGTNVDRGVETGA